MAMDDPNTMNPIALILKWVPAITRWEFRLPLFLKLNVCDPINCSLILMKNRPMSCENILPENLSGF